MKKLIIANWKMNPDSVGRAVRLARMTERALPRGTSVEVVIAPPFPFLKEVGGVLKRAKLGAQDAFWAPKGAYTGEVSGHQLRAIGVRYVILGHSERRAQGETDAMMQKKVRAVLAEGLTPVLCVGEPWSVRRKGLEAAKRFVSRQLSAALQGTSSKRRAANSLIIAYEPVWAIGTGKADRPAQAAAMAQFIRELPTTHYPLRTVNVLYGGSVAPKNASAFLRERAIGGALVGGASLKPREFRKIVEAAKNFQ